MRWISVKERVPTGRQADQLCLVLDRDSDYDIVYGWVIGAELNHFTHWMPVPKLPKDEL